MNTLNAYMRTCMTIADSSVSTFGLCRATWRSCCSRCWARVSDSRLKDCVSSRSGVTLPCCSENWWSSRCRCRYNCWPKGEHLQYIMASCSPKSLLKIIHRFEQYLKCLWVFFSHIFTSNRCGTYIYF